MMEYEQVRKNILLHIYLFSSEMKRRSTRQKERERERKAILYISSSLSLSPFFSFINSDDKKREGKRRD